MGPTSDGGMTRLLEAYRAGDREAFDRLVELAYAELGPLARRQLRRGAIAPTLETGALIHEAYLRLADQTGLDLRDRGHFYAVMARAMRFVVVDHARRRGAAKRGGRLEVTALDPDAVGASHPIELLLAVHGAVEMLESFAPRLARIVECRFFGGCSDEEIAEALGVSARTVQRDWLRARAWLQQSLGGAPAG
jgi:RNA polymerase sigma factor (TIGR02999 family)